MKVLEEVDPDYAHTANEATAMIGISGVCARKTVQTKAAGEATHAENQVDRVDLVDVK
jgi:hypothetical protein